MAYLKDVECEHCRSSKIKINSFYDRYEGKLYVDNATCQVCFKNIILPNEEYSPFVREFGIRE